MKDNGFGYETDKDTNEINMVLTVGGNFEAGKNYKIGVRAYKQTESGKYYGAEHSPQRRFCRYIHRQK